MTHKLEQFRAEIYEALPNRRDTLFDLLDSLSSNKTAQSVVELSLSSLFRREYSSITDGIDNFFQSTSEKKYGKRSDWDVKLSGIISTQIPVPKERKFYLFGLDVTSQPRPFAETLSDRTYVYQPNMLSKKPINIGHQSSLLAYLPEKGEKTPPWIVPLNVCRVSSEETKNEAGLKQVKEILLNEKLPFVGELVVLIGDTDYSSRIFLGGIYGDEEDETGNRKSDNQVVIVRVSSNRTFYHAPPEIEGKKPVGHPTWYGDPFRLKDEDTWGEPDEEESTTWKTHKGKEYTVHILCWHDIRMKGTTAHKMNEYPFTLVRVEVVDETGKPVFKRPMWLLVMGKRREEVSLVEAWEAYGQRVDLEHFFRFGKQRLLLNSYQTPDVEHEENWLQIVQLAYIFLWLAAELVEDLPRPWEKAAPKGEMASPSRTQRDFERIISQFGTPANAPKPRGYSQGRAIGDKQQKRERHTVIKKGQKSPTTA